MKKKIVVAIICGALACTPVYASPTQNQENNIE